VLYPDGPRYRALVLDRQTTMPLATAKKTLAIAQSGVPVVILGNAPTVALDAPDDPQQSIELAGVMPALKQSPNVVQVPGSDASVQASLPAVLRGLGIEPLTKPAEPTTLHTITREDGDTTFHFLFNASPTQTVQTTLSLSGSGRPYLLDSWTGQVTAVPVYQRQQSGLSVPVTLKPEETAILAITTDEASLGATPISSALSSSTGRIVAKGGQATIRTTQPGIVTSITQAGDRVSTLVPGAPAAFSPRDWKLDIASYERPATGTVSVVKHLPSITLPSVSGNLPSWQSIAAPVDLRDVSGQGTYSTSFELPQSWDDSMGAYLDLGTNGHAYGVTVNGTAVDGEDQVDARIDLGGMLHAGINSLTIRVSTTLRNAVLAQAPNRGGLPAGTQKQGYGLTGPVIITPYTDVPVVNNVAVGDGTVGGEVPATLALTLGAAASFGAFQPGVAREYTATSTATVTSTAGDATLSVSDSSSTSTGHLVNGPFALAHALEASANAGVFSPIGSSLTLLSYGAPVSNEAVRLDFRHATGSAEPLRTGSYAKTLTFTLSTTRP
jgi:hypothetical protein